MSMRKYRYRLLVSMATVLLRPWGLLQDALVTSNELIIYIDHLKAVLKLKSQGLALRQSE